MHVSLTALFVSVSYTRTILYIYNVIMLRRIVNLLQHGLVILSVIKRKLHI